MSLVMLITKVMLLLYINSVNYDAETVGNTMYLNGASGAIQAYDVVFFAPSGWAGFVCTVDKVATGHVQPQKTHIGAI